jgi:regulator of cell morphogenesis and NO signaling
MNSKATFRCAGDMVTDESAGATWEAQPPSAIIDFILRRFHEPLRCDLPALRDCARVVEAADKRDHLCPTGLADHLERILESVEGHLAKEEKILFPLILAGRGAMAFMPIKVMMAEHDDHLANLQRTRWLTHDFALPAGASEAWRTLYLDLQRLEVDLNRHIDLENNVLFTRVMGGEGATSIG